MIALLRYYKIQRDDHEYRRQGKQLWNTIKDKGFDFGERDLVQAMAACMTELEASGL